MSRAILIQQASGGARLLLELSVSRHAAYCANHDITYQPMFGDAQEQRAPHWNKIVLIRQALAAGFETVVWLDADTLIVRLDADIRSALNGGPPLALARHPGPGPLGGETHWNSGVMVLRNTPRTREFFDEVWKAGPLPTHHWHEQARILQLLPDFPDILQRLDDRWNSTVGANEVANPFIKAWHGLGTRALAAMYDELKSLGAVDERVAAVATNFVHRDNSVEHAGRFIERTPPYPDRFHGRGIVICGGGLGYFSCAWVCIHQLRRLGCTLPIQLWHLGRRELDDRMRALVAPLGVECVDGLALREQRPARILNGWELKPYALLNSPFREALLLDADNVAVVNPEFLFDTPEFGETGAIFWPDYGRLKSDRAAWRIFGVPYRDEPEFESGQIVLHKEKCWRPLNLTMAFNEHSDFFYDHVYGDKDTFRFAWHRLGEEFSMTPFPIHTLEGTMCQHDFTGRRIFQHRNTDKWNFYKGNKAIADFLFEEECMADLRRLRELWDGKIADASHATNPPPLPQ